MKLPSLLLVALSTLLSGCVGRLQTTPYLERTDSLSGALRGVTYSLPKLQYAVKMTRFLAECPGQVSDNGEPTALKFAVAIEATPQYVPGEAYTIDYEQLSGFTRTSNFEIKYWPNGNLKSIGAGAEDKTADIAKDVVKTAIGIWSSFGQFGSPFAAMAAPPPPPPPENLVNQDIVCTPEAAELVKNFQLANETIENSTARLEGLKGDIERIERQATLKLATKTDRWRLLALIEEMDAEQKKIGIAKKLVGKLSDALGVTDEFIWSGDRNQSATGQISYRPLSPDQASKLAAFLRLGAAAQPARNAVDAARRSHFGSCFASAPDALKCASEQLDLTIAVALPADVADCAGAALPLRECVAQISQRDRRFQNARDPKADSGIFVREPVQGQLMFCRTHRGPCEPKKDEAKLTPAYIPQLGQLRYLPLEVRAFQAKDMTLSMTEDGRVDTFSYKSTKAPGQVLASAAADIATQVDAALEKRETERRDDLAYARAQETADVQSEITRLTKQLELRKAQEALGADPLKPVTDQTTALKADIALLEAQLAKLKAERALVEASTAPGG